VWVERNECVLVIIFIKKMVDLLLCVFLVCMCSSGVFKRAVQVGCFCLFGYIGKCFVLCVGWVLFEEYCAFAEDFCDFMVGNIGWFVCRFEVEMR